VLLAVVGVLAAAVPAAAPVAASSSTTVTGLPSTPTNLTTRAGVDGVFLRWWAGAVTASAPAPTSFVVRRRAEGHDVTWVVPAGSAAMPGGQTSDTTLPAGMPASYTVAARRSTEESPESAPAIATVPTWDGPYSPARRTLTMVWDELEGGSSTGRETTQATADSAVPLTQDWANGLMGFAAGPGSVFALALDTPDGE